MFRYPEGLGRPFLWAHRGASASAPDNTLASFLLAHEQGADGVELDVHRTRDGVVAVVHDAWVSPLHWRFRRGTNLAFEMRVPLTELASGAVSVQAAAGASDVLLGVHQRQSPGRRKVAEMDWNELRTIVCGYDRDGSPLYIPRLEDVLEALPPSMAIDIEIKSAPDPFPDRAYPGLEDEVLAIVRRYRCEERAIVSSFDHRLLRRLATAAPDIATLAIFHARVVDAPSLARAIPTVNVDMELEYCDETDVRACHEAGIYATVGGLASAADFACAARWGADGVTLDDPRWAVPESGLQPPAAARA